MAFEPLQTDEKLEGPIKRERDMDTHMLFGCGAFVFASIMCYSLIIWPFFVIRDVYLLKNLGTASLIAIVPSALLAGIMTRRSGLAGACGFVGGAICGSVFLYLRLSHLFLSSRLQQSPTPEFPEAVTFMIPTGLVVLFLIEAVILLPKSEHVFDDSSS